MKNFSCGLPCLLRELRCTVATNPVLDQKPETDLYLYSYITTIVNKNKSWRILIDWSKNLEIFEDDDFVKKLN